jgi:hypothetical protein
MTAPVRLAHLHVVPKLILIAMTMPLTPILAKISPYTRLRISTPGRPINRKMSPANAKMQKTIGVKFLPAAQWRGHGWHFAPSKNRGPLPAVWASEFSSPTCIVLAFVTALELAPLVPCVCFRFVLPPHGLAPGRIGLITPTWLGAPLS